MPLVLKADPTEAPEMHPLLEVSATFELRLTT